jgi:hypothetical protein
MNSRNSMVVATATFVTCIIIVVVVRLGNNISLVALPVEMLQQPESMLLPRLVLYACLCVLRERRVQKRKEFGRPGHRPWFRFIIELWRIGKLS